MSTKILSPHRDFLVEHRRLFTTDLDLARESVSRMWEYHRSHLLRGRKYAISWHQADLADFTLSYVRTSSTIRIDCGPVSDTFRVTLHESGRIKHWIDGAPAISLPSRAVLHVPGQELRLETEPFRVLLLSFNKDVVMRALQARAPHDVGTYQWLRDFSLDTPAGISLRSLCRWAAGEMDRPGYGALNTPEAAQALQKTLLMLLFDCIEGACPGAFIGEDRSAAMRVQRVEDWIHEHFADPVAVEDLARIAGTSVRSLQVSCRRWRGCTPMDLVRRKRLEEARAALQSSPPGQTVTTIAAQCGFFNFGRFATRYRAAFGEGPAQTLASSAGRARSLIPLDK